MTNFNFPWTKSFEFLGKNEYSKYILERKFKTSFNTIMYISNIAIFSFPLLSICLAIYVKQIEIAFLGILATIFIPTSIRRLFEFIISNEIQQFDLDCVFILRELIVISQSTNSESQAYFLLASNSNNILSSFGKNAFIEKNISSIVSVTSIINELEKIKHSKVTSYLMTIFTNWMTSDIDISIYTANFQKIIQAKLDDDFHDLENNITIINALIGLFPILIIFLIFIGFKTIHPLLEVSLLLFIAIQLLIWVLDPLRIEPIMDFYGSTNNIENFDGSMILQEFFSLLIRNQNISKSLLQLIHNKNRYNRNGIGNENFNMNFINNANANSSLIDLVTENRGSKLKNLFLIFLKLEKIDFDTILRQLPEFISNYSSIQQYYQKKFDFIKTERKKSGLIINLNAFTLGILSVILPYLFFINSFSFSTVNNSYLTPNLTPKLELIISFEFLVLLWIIYLIYYKGYALNSNDTLYKNLILNSTLFTIGFLFSLSLLRPIITLL